MVLCLRVPGPTLLATLHPVALGTKTGPVWVAGPGISYLYLGRFTYLHVAWGSFRVTRVSHAITVQLWYNRCTGWRAGYAKEVLCCTPYMLVPILAPRTIRQPL